jgi:membrane associated rhomboid family serine protease
MMKITFVIILICAIVFFVIEPIAPLLDHFVLQQDSLLERPWIILTSMFAHGSFEHLLFNMFALFMFGLVLEQRLGTNKFIFLYLLAGLIGSVGFMIFNPPYARALGASGAIYGVFGALAYLVPNMRVYIYLVPVPMWLAGILYAGISLFGIGGEGIAHSAHLLGLIGGLAIAYREGKENWPPKPQMDMWKAVMVPVALSFAAAVMFGVFAG